MTKVLAPADVAAQALQDRRKAALEAYIELHGLPPTVTEGSRVEHFNPLQLASGIEYEVARATIEGLGKIQLRMDLRDAFLLAQHLRKVNRA
jgi:hypothetical protein